MKEPKKVKEFEEKRRASLKNEFIMARDLLYV